jgi:hypothetical protein
MKSMMALTGVAVVAAAFNPSRSSAPKTEFAVEFPHAVHNMLIADCATCHGVATPDGSAYPEPVFCGTCHNGSVAPEVGWTPPEERVSRNKRFDHASHMEAASNECADCHVVSGSSNGTIKVAILEQCQDCHEQANVAMSSSPWHGGGWVNRHAADAAASPEGCASCHVRQDCLDCHRPDAASGSPGYHRADFLTGHATSAYSRETSCNDCHNSGAFCASCHLQAGLVASSGSGSAFHDASSSFVTGHGQAARQSLESCAACHAEADCVRCHSVGTGRISPHGPGWEGEDLREKNPRMCILCHGTTIPEGG